MYIIKSLNPSFFSSLVVPENSFIRVHSLTPYIIANMRSVNIIIIPLDVKKRPVKSTVKKSSLIGP